MPTALVTPVAARLRDPVTRHGLVGFAGSTALAVGALGVGYLPTRSRVGSATIADVLRTTTVGLDVAKVCVLAGTLLLLAAWFLLGADVQAGRITSTGRLTRMFWLWVIPIALVPPLFSQDVYSYAAQGNLLNVGYNPYHFGPSAVPSAYLPPVGTMWLDTPAPYGPSFLYLGKLTAEICGSHIFLAALMMRGYALVGIYLIARYLPRLARACNVDAPLAVWAGLMNPLVLMHFVSGAHNDALMLGLVVAGLALALEGHPLVGALVIALGGTVKAPALLALGFVGLAWATKHEGRLDSRRATRIVAWIAVSCVALATFLVINAATGLTFGWTSALGTPAMVRTLLSPTTAIGMFFGWVVQVAGFGNHTPAILSAVRTLAEVAILATIAWWLLRRRAISPAAGAGAALLLVATLGPVLQAWYVLWGLIVLSATSLTRRGLPYLTSGVTTLVAYCLLQPVATTSPLVRFADWTVSIFAFVIGLTMLLCHASVRNDLRQLRRTRRTRATATTEDAAETEDANTIEGSLGPLDGAGLDSATLTPAAELAVALAPTVVEDSSGLRT